MGKFIAIEGLDGSGKSTQIDLLIAHFNARGVETKFVHFPRTDGNVFGDLIAKFLRGEFGDLKNVHPQLVALLFAEDRKDFAKTMQQWLQDDYVVLVDRYVWSNIAFQCAKLNGIEEKMALRNWINMFEFEYNKIPKPDLSIYLDVPFEFTNRSLTERRAGEKRAYLQGKDDIHENDMALQAAVKAEYEYLADRSHSITKLSCYASEDTMKSVDEIHKMLVRYIDDIL